VVELDERDRIRVREGRDRRVVHHDVAVDAPAPAPLDRLPLERVTDGAGRPGRVAQAAAGAALHEQAPLRDAVPEEGVVVGDRGAGARRARGRRARAGGSARLGHRSGLPRAPPSRAPNGSRITAHGGWGAGLWGAAPDPGSGRAPIPQLLSPPRNPPPPPPRPGA